MMPAADQMSRLLVRFAAAALTLACVWGCESSEAAHVCNVHTVVPGLLLRGCQPDQHGLRELRDDFGVRTVVNFNDRTPKSGATLAARLGLNYLPLPDNAISEKGDRKRYLAFLKVVRDAGQNGDAVVYVHCSTGTDRAGLAVGVYRVVECGWDADRALAELHLFQR